MESMPLSFVTRGKSGKVEAVLGGKILTKKLMEMGFSTGIQIEMIKNDLGPLIIALGGTRIAIGRGMAQKILVTPC